VDEVFYLNQRKLNKGFRGGVGEAESRWLVDWISVRDRDSLLVREI
jgi:hypothetical protein